MIIYGSYYEQNKENSFYDTYRYGYKTYYYYSSHDSCGHEGFWKFDRSVMRKILSFYGTLPNFMQNFANIIAKNCIAKGCVTMYNTNLPNDDNDEYSYDDVRYMGSWNDLEY